MNGVRVKVCGITRLEDARLCDALGVDALGFNFWKGSKRYCPPEEARRILRELSPFILPVGLFVNAPRDEVLRIIERTGIRAVQLHGDERPKDCRGFPVPVLKAVAVQGPDSVRRLAAFHVAGFVLDTPSTGRGGSGVAFDWRVLRTVRPERPFLLAGGLTPANVASAVRRVWPHGVDVASGVEKSPGVKDAAKLRRFVAAAKEA